MICRFLIFGSLLIFLSCKKDCPKVECADADLAKGLKAYYPFNENANDESGNGNNAVAYNGAHFSSDMVGRVSRSAEFDGIDDYFLVQDNGRLNSEDVTVSMIIMVTNTNRRQAFLNRVNTNSATGFAYGLGQSLDAANRWDFGVGDPSKDCNSPLVYEDGLYARSTETSQPGRWYHLIGIFSKGIQKLYVDGQLKVTLNRSFNSIGQCANTSLILGGWWKNDIVSGAGKIDEVRIYDRVLNECEIDELSKVFKE